MKKGTMYAALAIALAVLGLTLIFVLNDRAGPTGYAGSYGPTGLAGYAPTSNPCPEEDIGKIEGDGEQAIDCSMYAEGDSPGACAVRDFNTFNEDGTHCRAVKNCVPGNSCDPSPDTSMDGDFGKPNGCGGLIGVPNTEDLDDEGFCSGGGTCVCPSSECKDGDPCNVFEDPEFCIPLMQEGSGEESGDGILSCDGDSSITDGEPCTDFPPSFGITPVNINILEVCGECFCDAFTEFEGGEGPGAQLFQGFCNCDNDKLCMITPDGDGDLCFPTEVPESEGQSCEYDSSCPSLRQTCVNGMCMTADAFGCDSEGCQELLGQQQVGPMNENNEVIVPCIPGDSNACGGVPENCVSGNGNGNEIFYCNDCGRECGYNFSGENGNVDCPRLAAVLGPGVECTEGFNEVNVQSQDCECTGVTERQCGGCVNVGNTEVCGGNE